MIIHPLDLDSKLRAPPRSFDWAFFVNITLIGAFFLFFGSRFILSPAIVVDGGFRTSVVPAAEVSYVSASVVVSIKANGQIFTDTGLVTRAQLNAWLGEKAKTAPDASLLIRADAMVPSHTLSNITFMARRAGFKIVSSLVEPGKTDSPAPSAPPAPAR